VRSVIKITTNTMKQIKLLAGITESDELYFLEINEDNNNRNGYPES
jgi:hypothetical protein